MSGSLEMYRAMFGLGLSSHGAGSGTNLTYHSIAEFLFPILTLSPRVMFSGPIRYSFTLPSLSVWRSAGHFRRVRPSRRDWILGELDRRSFYLLAVGVGILAFIASVFELRRPTFIPVHLLSVLMTTARQLSYARYLALALVAALTAGSFYVALFFFQLGPFMPADYWIRDAFVIKEYLAEATEEGPRILVVAGSGSLFGIDSGLIERETGRRTINLAINGGFGARLHRETDPSSRRARRRCPGTARAELHPTAHDPAVVLQQRHGVGRLVLRLSFGLGEGKFRLFGGSGSDRSGGLNRCLEKRVPEQIRRARRGRRDEIISSMETVWASGSIPETPDQPFKRLTRNGDLVSVDRLDREFKNYYKGYLSGDPSVRPGFVRLFTEFRDDLHEMDARLILLWPATMTDETFDLSREAAREVVATFRENLGSHGVPHGRLAPRCALPSGAFFRHQLPPRRAR